VDADGVAVATANNRFPSLPVIQLSPRVSSCHLRDPYRDDIKTRDLPLTARSRPFIACALWTPGNELAMTHFVPHIPLG